MSRCCLFVLVLFFSQTPVWGEGFRELEPGLDFGEFAAPMRSEEGDSAIRVLRIDPGRFSLVLLNASREPKKKSYTAKEWAKQEGLLAAINASLYQQDLRTSVSLMRTPGHTNNARLSKDNTILAFDALDARVPNVKMIDRRCEDFAFWQKKYRSFIQSIRMISCKGENVWTQQSDKRWSTSAVGVDGSGNVLFIHVGAPYSTHDVIEMLQTLPLDIQRAMYTEGGREAQLYVQSGETEHEFLGRSDSLFDFSSRRPIPNVLGIRRKQ